MPIAVPKTYRIYQDRSGTFGNDQWLIWGNLAVAEDAVSGLASRLATHRRTQLCESELHFSDLPGNWGGIAGKKPRTVFSWFEETQKLLSGQNGIYFYALAVDVKSTLFKAERFKHAFHVYNRFSRASLSWMQPWCFKGKSTRIRLFMHQQTFQGRGAKSIVSAGRDWDNLSDYVHRELNNEFAASQSETALERKPIFVPLTFSASEDYTPEDCEHMQLTDLLIGGVRQAITGRSAVNTKKELGSILGHWMADIRRKPWEQELGLHRKFSVSYFPGPSGAYQDGPLVLGSRILSKQKQYEVGTNS